MFELAVFEHVPNVMNKVSNNKLVVAYRKLTMT